jgi:hypothetical protein
MAEEVAVALDRPDLQTWEPGEARGISGQHHPVGRDRGCRDDEVVGAPRPPRPADRRQQVRVGSGDGQVVVLDGDRAEHCLHEFLSPLSMPCCGKLHSYQELR